MACAVDSGHNMISPLKLLSACCRSTVSGNANLVAHRILERLPHDDQYVTLQRFPSAASCNASDSPTCWALLPVEPPNVRLPPSEVHIS